MEIIQSVMIDILLCHSLSWLHLGVVKREEISDYATTRAESFKCRILNRDVAAKGICLDEAIVSQKEIIEFTVGDC